MRVIFNTSYIVNDPVEKDWVDFMKKTYVDYIQTNVKIMDVIFTKVSIDQPEGKTYSMQIIFEDEKDLEEYKEKHLPWLEKEIITKYHGFYLCFSSVLTEV